jgi:hypothetical protein
VEDNIKIGLRGIVSEVVDWNKLDHDGVKWWAFISMVINFQVP